MSNTVNKQTEHLIFGAGLIGGYIAGCLNFDSHDTSINVSVVGRDSMRARFSQALKLSDYKQNQGIANTIKFVEQPNQNHLEYDYVWLTVKAVDIDSALSDLAPYVTDKTTILCCQNGLGSDELLKQAFPNNRVLRAIVVFNVAEISPHHLHRGSLGNLIIQQLSDADKKLVEQVNSQLLPTIGVDDIDAHSWAKLQLNLTNALNALADMPVRDMLEKRRYRKIIALCMDELLSVTRKMDMKLPKFTPIPATWIPRLLNMPNFIFLHAGRKMMDIDPTVRTSMWWDLKNHKLTEVDLLNGAVLKKANELGIDCPANQHIVDLIHLAEQSELREEFSPSDFLQAIATG